jgi:hypothetical protein
VTDDGAGLRRHRVELPHVVEDASEVSLIAGDFFGSQLQPCQLGDAENVFLGQHRPPDTNREARTTQWERRFGTVPVSRSSEVLKSPQNMTYSRLGDPAVGDVRCR